jgi:hypothetical protein
MLKEIKQAKLYGQIIKLNICFDNATTNRLLRVSSLLLGTSS